MATDWRTSCGCNLTDFQPSLRSSVPLDLLKIITGLPERWGWLITLFGMIRECVLVFLNKTLKLDYDSYITHPEKPKVDYPDCFHSKEIPVHGPSVAQLIEDRVSSRSWCAFLIFPLDSFLFAFCFGQGFRCWSNLEVHVHYYYVVFSALCNSFVNPRT